ncbi:MAG: hypothetical protein ACJA1R_002553 [Flavobacteriales bacterium]|jgi:hypothetical protein
MERRRLWIPTRSWARRPCDRLPAIVDGFDGLRLGQGRWFESRWGLSTVRTTHWLVNSPLNVRRTVDDGGPWCGCGTLQHGGGLRSARVLTLACLLRRSCHSANWISVASGTPRKSPKGASARRRDSRALERWHSSARALTQVRLARGELGRVRVPKRIPERM